MAEHSLQPLIAEAADEQELVIPTRIRPPLRWAGSKKKQIPKLLSLLPTLPAKIIEPFAGSACFTLQAGITPSVISDVNEDLIAFYQDLRTNTEELHREFDQLPVDPKTYYEVRNLYNKSERSILKSAWFLYLNRYGFNGLYRVNKSGEYNVPWGGEKSGSAPNLAELKDVASRLTGITIRTGDFQKVVCDELIPGALIYLDPPYARHEVRVFREYYPNSFTTLDWQRLVNLLDLIDSTGAHFILSYAGDPELVGALTEWEVGRLEVTRNVGGFAASRRKHSEFIASNIKS